MDELCHKVFIQLHVRISLLLMKALNVALVMGRENA